MAAVDGRLFDSHRGGYRDGWTTDARAAKGRDRGETVGTALCVSAYELDSGVPVEPP